MFGQPTDRPELRDRAVRMVAEVVHDYPSESAAIIAVAGILGIDNPETLRKWVYEAPSGHDRRNTLPSRWHFLKVAWRHPVISGVIVTVLGGLILIYFESFLGVHRMAPSLEVDGVSLSPPAFENKGGLGPFKIDIKLLNTGTQLAAINDARLIIQQSAVVPICNSQGEFNPTGTYKSNMPRDPVPGQVIDIPVSQLVPAGGADRFDLLLSTRLPRGHGEADVHLYRIHIYLNYNVHANPVDVGEVLVDFPFAPDGGEYYLSHYYVAHPQIIKNTVYAAGLAQYKKCVVKNSHTLHYILSLPAKRTSQMAAIPSQLAY